MTSEAKDKNLLPRPRTLKCVFEDPWGQGHEGKDSITVFDSQLNFEMHINGKVNKAYIVSLEPLKETLLIY